MDFSCQKFGLELLKCILTDSFDTNVIYSPMSIYFALGMAQHGAHGKTKEEIISTLHWNVRNPESFYNEISKVITEFNKGGSETGLLNLMNKLFVENSYLLKQSFIDNVKEKYENGLAMMDFKENFDKSRRTINSWIEEETNGKIKNLLANGSVDSLTKLILINCIYFKGSWQHKFNECGKHNFHLLNSLIKPVEMINNCCNYSFLENKTLGFRAIMIPFRRIHDNNYFVMLILPDKVCGLPELETTLFKKKWYAVLGNDLFQQHKVNLIMPKFKIENSFNLKSILQTLGMITSFSGTADFSLITEDTGIKIDEIFHKAFIEVDENGVEAATATTGIMISSLGKKTTSIEFKCDHPFMFALLKEGTLPIFLGHVVNF